ncbi:spore germination protein [Halanaerocella petrolearia]
MKEISNLQFILTIIIFTLGSSILFPLGIGAKKDAYFVILVSMVIGIILVLLYTRINSIAPDKTFIQILQQVFGKYLGWLLGSIYSIFFLYLATRNIRDLAEQIIQNLLPKSNMLIISLLTVILAIYATYQNLHTITRISLIIGPYILINLTLTNIYLIFVAGRVTKLVPYLSKGFMPILKEVFTKMLAFPLAELAIFMMIIPKIDTSLTKVKKSFIIAVIIAFLTLTMNTISMLSILGPKLAEKTTFPLIKSGELGQFSIINFDFLIASISTLALMMKIFLSVYAGVKGTSQLFNISYHKLTLILPIPLIYLTKIVAKGYPQHIELGLGPSLTINNIVGIFLPIITLVVYYLKKPFQKSK